MQSPVTVKFRWSADDLYEAYCCHQRQRCRHAFRVLMNASIYSFVVLGCVAGVVAYRAGDSWGFFLAIVLSSFLWWSRSYWYRWLVKRQFAKRPDRNVDVEWEIAPDKVLVRSPLGHAEYKWEAFAKVVRTPSGIMFYPLEQIFHYLPRRGFANEAELEQVAALVASRVHKFRSVM
jgi:hypothetical protein